MPERTSSANPSQSDRHAATIARMVQPQCLKSDEYQPWSRGRGVDVWAMICAAITGDLETISNLVTRDRNLVTCEYEYFTPLRFAVRENQRTVVDFLLEHGADPAYEAGESLLTIARERGYEELTILFESRLKERYGIVPESVAVAVAINQDPRRDSGARPAGVGSPTAPRGGWRDVPSTALQRHEILIGYLLARGAYYDISTATKIGDLDRVRELLNQDPRLINQVPAYTYYTGLPLRNAAGAGHLEIVKLLLERGTNPDQPEPGIAPHGGALHAAIGGKHYAIVKLLLEHGASPNAEVESSGNCLSMAKFAWAPQDIVDLIASFGGVVGADMADVETLAAMLHANPQLSVGERLDSPNIMDLILRYQPDILKRTPDPTAWWSLATPKTPEYARWLMRRGLDPNRRNWLGMTLLHRCAAKGDIDMASVCLEFGGDIDAIETDSSSTPLAWAALEGKKEMVEWLLKQGAKSTLPEDEPWAQPSEWARRQGHMDIVELLCLE